MNNPIYQPAGRAREYGEWALNIYQGCPFSCTYCYCPGVLRITKEQFHSNYQPRPGIVEAVQKQLKKGDWAGKLIHLCFIGDPYGSDDTIPTREIIQLIKSAGANVQILTKGGDRARRDFDLLDSGDWFGITLSCDSSEVRKLHEPNAASNSERYESILQADARGIKTWISFDPFVSLKNAIPLSMLPN